VEKNTTIVFPLPLDLFTDLGKLMQQSLKPSK